MYAAPRHQFGQPFILGVYSGIFLPGLVVTARPAPSLSHVRSASPIFAGANTSCPLHSESPCPYWLHCLTNGRNTASNASANSMRSGYGVTKPKQFTGQFT